MDEKRTFPKVPAASISEPCLSPFLQTEANSRRIRKQASNCTVDQRTRASRDARVISPSVCQRRSSNLQNRALTVDRNGCFPVMRIASFVFGDQRLIVALRYTQAAARLSGSAIYNPQNDSALVVRAFHAHQQGDPAATNHEQREEGDAKDGSVVEIHRRAVLQERKDGT